MFFYCTTKIRNYYKVGVASSLDRIKQRLTTYRTSNPNVKIKFFSEIDDLDQDLEWSFKNKFDYYRVAKSECYRLDLDVIYKHFLKFQHKFNKLHHFWSVSKFYLSEYYIDKEFDDDQTFNFSETTLKDARFGYFPSFIPIAYLKQVRDKIDKDGNKTIEAKILDINKVDLKDYRYKYKQHLKEKFYGQQYGYLSDQFQKFFDNNFKIKKKFKVKSILHVESAINLEIFKMFEKKNKSLIKKYPQDPVGCAYWQRPEQKDLTVKSITLNEKIINKFQEKHDINYILNAITSSVHNSNEKLYLETFFKVLMRFKFSAPKNLKYMIYKLEEEIRNQLKVLNKNEKISLPINKPKVKNKHLKVIK